MSVAVPAASQTGYITHMSDQPVTPLGDQPINIPPTTTRAILWRIAKELANIGKELAHINGYLKQISQKMK